MSRKSEEKLAEITRWFMWHKKTIIDPDKRAEHLETVMTNMMYLLSYIIEDIQKLEGREKQILLPKGVALHQQIRN